MVDVTLIAMAAGLTILALSFSLFILTRRFVSAINESEQELRELRDREAILRRRLEGSPEIGEEIDLETGDDT